MARLNRSVRGIQSDPTVRPQSPGASGWGWELAESPGEAAAELSDEYSSAEWGVVTSAICPGHLQAQQQLKEFTVCAPEPS